MSEYRTVWLDKDGEVWTYDPGQGYEEYGPFVPSKAVPADAVVIERSELPEVTTGEGINAVGVSGQVGVPLDFDPARALARARAWLAVAHHLRAHPPVDEAEVAVIREHVQAYLGITPDDHPNGLISGPLARFLVERGVRVSGGAS